MRCPSKLCNFTFAKLAPGNSENKTSEVNTSVPCHNTFSGISPEFNPEVMTEGTGEFTPQCKIVREQFHQAGDNKRNMANVLLTNE